MNDVKEFLKACVPWAAVARKTGKQSRLGIVNPKRRFAVVAFDIQQITSKTDAGNTEAMIIVDAFTRFVRALAIPVGKTETMAQGLLQERISLFGPRKSYSPIKGLGFLPRCFQICPPYWEWSVL